MGCAKPYPNLAELPEVKELIEFFAKRGYDLWHCGDIGLRMQKVWTEVHLLPETDRLRFLVHDEGMDTKETKTAQDLVKKIMLQHGYNYDEESCGEEYHKYF